MERQQKILESVHQHLVCSCIVFVPGYYCSIFMRLKTANNTIQYSKVLFHVLFIKLRGNHSLRHVEEEKERERECLLCVDVIMLK